MILGDHLNKELEEGDEIRWEGRKGWVEVVDVEEVDDEREDGEIVAEGPRGGEYRIVTTTATARSKYRYRIYASGAEEYYTAYDEIEVKDRHLPLEAWKHL